jgi:hypothetical protein
MPEPGIIKIKADDLPNYTQCPMRFKLNGWKTPEIKKAKPKLGLTEYVEESLLETIKFIFRRHAFTGEAPTLGATLKLWNKVWKKIFSMFGNDEGTTNLYKLQTLRLSDYYATYVLNTNKNIRVPFMYDYSFVVNYDNVDLISSIDFGFVTKGGRYEGVELGFIGGDIKNRIGDGIRTNYNVLLSVFKFREDYKVPCNFVLYLSSSRLKWTKVPIPYTNEQLYSIILDICKSLYTRIGFRNPGTYCKDCKFNKNLLCEF